MDLKYNLARARLLRDRSPLPITTLEVIKDSSEFVNLASSEHHGRVLFFLLFKSIPFSILKKSVLHTGIPQEFNAPLL